MAAFHVQHFSTSFELCKRALLRSIERLILTRLTQFGAHRSIRARSTSIESFIWLNLIYIDTQCSISSWASSIPSNECDRASKSQSSGGVRTFHGCCGRRYSSAYLESRVEYCISPKNLLYAGIIQRDHVIASILCSWDVVHLLQQAFLMVVLFLCRILWFARYKNVR